MQKTTKEIRLDEARIKYNTVIVSKPTMEGSLEARTDQFYLLNMIANDPKIIACGPVPFQTLKMYHNGTFWVIEAEAIEEVPLDEG